MEIRKYDFQFVECKSTVLANYHYIPKIQVGIIDGLEPSNITILSHKVLTIRFCCNQPLVDTVGVEPNLPDCKSSALSHYATGPLFQRINGNSNPGFRGVTVQFSHASRAH